MARAKDGIDPATRTFQALRIYVNDELGELGGALNHIFQLPNIAGPIVLHHLFQAF